MASTARDDADQVESSHGRALLGGGFLDGGKACDGNVAVAAICTNSRTFHLRYRKASVSVESSQYRRHELPVHGMSNGLLSTPQTDTPHSLQMATLSSPGSLVRAGTSRISSRGSDAHRGYRSSFSTFSVRGVPHFFATRILSLFDESRTPVNPRC